MYGSIKIAQKLAMMNKLFLLLAVASSIMTAGLAGTSTTTKRPTGKNNSGVTPADQCGVWVKEPEGGQFTSPNYPQRYPPERECTYIIEAAPRQCIDLFFDDRYSIEPSWDCKFDHIEVRDGPFSFSPIIGRYCGQQSPAYVRSSGRYLYVKFVADGELEAMGFSARYNFTKDPEFIDKGELPPLPFCDFEMGGPEGIAESIAVTLQSRALPTEAVDCRWYIRAPPGHKINLRFLEYEMHNSNECKRNFVAIYDGSSSVEHLKNKYCSTVANDLMLTSSVGVIRLWADEGSRRSRFRILYTTFHEPPCEGDTFFCHSNMCINNTLVCNGIQNCVFPWDENHCKEKRKSSILDNLDHTNVTIIAVTCGLVVILLIISCIIQIKQPRKKYIIRREDFDPTLLHPAFDPPHYELCTLRRSTSADDIADDIADDFDKFQKLRRSSSRCIRDHHCGSQQGSVHGSMHGSMHGSVHGSRSNLSMRDATCLSDSVAGGSGPPPPPPPPPPLLPPPQQQLFLPQLSPHAQHGTLQGRRSVLVMKHSYSQDGGVEGAFCDQDDEDDMMMDDGPTTSHHPHHHLHPHPLHQSMLGLEQNIHHSMSNDFYY